jgi:DNA polymerase delta subunit 1
MNEFYRNPVVPSMKKNLKFQALEWFKSDETDDETGAQVFVLRAFGVDDSGNSVCCSIEDYHPFIYIKVPETWQTLHVRNYLDALDLYPKARKGLDKQSIELVRKKDFKGFHGDDKFKFARLEFFSEKSMKNYIYAIKQKNGKLYETNMDALLKFLHATKIQPSNWVNVKSFRVERDEEETSSCQINIRCSWKDIHPHEKDGNANFLQASFDIETYSKPVVKDGKLYYPFPVPSIKENVVYQIATCFKRQNEPGFLVKHILTLKTCAPIDDPSIFVTECESEKDLLLKWKKLICLMDPDILYQYNGDMFDCKYMCKRAEMHGILDKFCEISRMLSTEIPWSKDGKAKSIYQAQLTESTFSSSAYGTSDYSRLVIPGRINFDILIFIKREFKENSYKLDSVSEKYLGERKNPVKVVDIFKAYETGDPQQIRKICEYCIVDTLLPQKLVDKLNIIQTQISMSNVTFVPIKYLIERGQQVKALSQIAKNTMEKGFLIPHLNYVTGEPFKGAHVFEPEKGAYFTAVTVLDFASLYPSIIRAHNLCFSSIVMDDKYKDLPGVEYLDVHIDDKIHTFAQNTTSILPDLLADLAVQRKKYKKLMEKESDPSIKEIYNKTQLAYKVSMNSVYGILGSGVGYTPIAASVTQIGREMLEKTRDYIETRHHCVFPEGKDSCVLDGEDTVTIMENGIEKTVTVECLLGSEKTSETSEKTLIKTTEGWRLFECLEIE